MILFLLLLLVSGPAHADELTLDNLNSGLRMAARENRIRSLADYLRRGADPNCIDDFGTTPLMLASMKGNPKVVQILLKGGADAKRTTAESFTALHYAARQCNHPAIPDLILAGADVNARNQLGQTALMLAADQGCGHAVRELLRYRQIRIGLKDDYGKTALDYAKDADIMGVDGTGYDLILVRMQEKEALLRSTVRVAPAP